MDYFKIYFYIFNVVDLRARSKLTFLEKHYNRSGDLNYELMAFGKFCVSGCYDQGQGHCYIAT